MESFICGIMSVTWNQERRIVLDPEPSDLGVHQAPVNEGDVGEVSVSHWCSQAFGIYHSEGFQYKGSARC